MPSDLVLCLGHLSHGPFHPTLPHITPGTDNVRGDLDVDTWRVHGTCVNGAGEEDRNRGVWAKNREEEEEYQGLVGMSKQEKGKECGGIGEEKSAEKSSEKERDD